MKISYSLKLRWILISIVVFILTTNSCGGPPPPGGGPGGAYSPAGPGGGTDGYSSSSENRQMSSDESKTQRSVLSRIKPMRSAPTANTNPNYANQYNQGTRSKQAGQATEAAMPSSSIEEVNQTYSKIMSEAGKKTSDVMSKLSSVEEAATYGRKLTVNNNLSMQVDRVDGSKEKIRNIIVDKGYVGASVYSIDDEGNPSATITIRVKVEFYDEVREALLKIGQVIGETETIQDISDEYFDLQSYINTRQLYLNRLKSLLAEQKTLDNIISLTEMVTNVQGEINKSKGQLNRFDDQAKFSTIILELKQPTRIKSIKNNTPQIQRAANPKFMWTHKEAIDEGMFTFKARINAIINFFIYQLTGNLLQWLLIIVLIFVVRFYVVKYRINVFELHHHFKFPDKEE